MKQYIEDKIKFWKEKFEELEEVRRYSPRLITNNYYRAQAFIVAYEDVLRVIEEQEELNCKKMNHAMREETTEEKGSRSNPKA